MRFALFAWEKSMKSLNFSEFDLSNVFILISMKEIEKYDDMIEKYYRLSVSSEMVLKECMGRHKLARPFVTFRKGFHEIAIRTLLTVGDLSTSELSRLVSIRFVISACA